MTSICICVLHIVALSQYLRYSFDLLNPEVIDSKYTIMFHCSHPKQFCLLSSLGNRCISISMIREDIPKSTPHDAYRSYRDCIKAFPPSVPSSTLMKHCGIQEQRWLSRAISLALHV